jgi:hypothetical protein
MGIIDSTSVKLTCAKCGATETGRAVQKGSSYGAGSWGDFGAFFQLDVASEQGIDGPEVTSADCKKCKVPARIE